MQTIHINHPHSFVKSDFPPLVLALGFFDGVHRGHKKVIQTAMEEADRRGEKSGVMTFDPHPKEVLRKGAAIDYLTPLSKKESEIGKIGPDFLFVVHFTPEFAELTPQNFCDDYLIGLNVKHVVAGFDYSYGRLGKGTMETIEFHSRGAFSHTVVGKVDEADEKISSTRIRETIRSGELYETKKLLGRNYETSGTVVHGEKRGRTIGFPTANVDKDQAYLIPKPGVYAVELGSDGQWLKGMCNIGFKPTFNEKAPDKPAVEIHLFDFTGDLYGKKVLIRWHERIRSEKAFSGVDELIAQLKADEGCVRDFFAKIKEI
ncbi:MULTISPECIES: bifunctional riboflavin kinase/FAD synthetase [Alteribacter]|uniref:Riboflavin biosynthesis protein n=1 Tax=Alteribacter keqinensis TaxID=2483800 RepID=A0A3M7TV86_9BACI|nr:bifunctional riboflavin kinase/FAD synthetase [Alteribacter keqinensis]MBM7094221.1 bifunctional riboflavin kinase/FAD synthetase [Alteribacter salitolerans]RNA69546.1 bifunctional riboflavin kinase/FAD synthetase [Alteribacter keqinensis]